MKMFHRALVASAVALACSAGTASAQFSNMYFFGDSLSDAGRSSRSCRLAPAVSL